jgi:hypothetical protein
VHDDCADGNPPPLFADVVESFETVDVQKQQSVLEIDRVEIIRVLNPRNMPAAPAHAGEVESIVAALERLRGMGAETALVHNIPAGIYVDISITLGENAIPESMIGEREYEFCKRFHQKMVVDSISSIIIRAIYEDLRTFNDFKVAYRHTQQLLETGAEQWTQSLAGGISLGCALDLHKEAMQEVHRIALLEKRGTIHPFEILSINFKNGAYWSLEEGVCGDVAREWSSTALRYAWLTASKTLNTSIHEIVKLKCASVAQNIRRITGLCRDGLGVLVRPEIVAQRRTVGIVLHSQFGMLHRHGPLWSTNDVYRRVVQHSQ